MPPKKRSQPKNQPTLNQFIEKQEKSQLGPVDREAKINSMMEKLVKVRVQIQQKKREEERLLNSILRLKIAEKPVDSLPLFITDEQYWIMTTQESLMNNNVGMFSFLLSEYGQTISSKNQREICQQTNIFVECLAIQQKQWKQHGSLKPEYLKNFTFDFINCLKEYQYVAGEAENNE